MLYNICHIAYIVKSEKAQVVIDLSYSLTSSPGREEASASGPSTPVQAGGHPAQLPNSPILQPVQNILDQASAVVMNVAQALGYLNHVSPIENRNGILYAYTGRIGTNKILKKSSIRMFQQMRAVMQFNKTANAPARPRAHTRSSRCGAFRQSLR